MRVFLLIDLVRKGGLEPPHLAAPEPKSGASTNSATFAIDCSCLNTLNEPDKLYLLFRLIAASLLCRSAKYRFAAHMTAI